jgi:hemerythrin-like domain-containing protein
MHALFKMLKEEHKEAKQILQTILDKAEKEDEIDQKLIKKVCEALTRHMDMEERYLYPVAEKKKALKEDSEEAELEHEAARKLIKQLTGSRKLDDIECKVKVEMLQLDIEHHVREEESEFFPKIEEHFSKEQLNDIYENMKAFVEQAELAGSTR